MSCEYCTDEQKKESSDGHWLAGLVDGEGCFQIVRYHGGAQHRCRFTLALRADDTAVVQRARDILGVGDVRFYPCKTESRPLCTLVVNRKADIYHLLTFFSRFPLRSKKGLDFAHWSRHHGLPTGGKKAEESYRQMRGLRRYRNPFRLAPGEEDHECSICAPPAAGHDDMKTNVFPPVPEPPFALVDDVPQSEEDSASSSSGSRARGNGDPGQSQVRILPDAFGPEHKGFQIKGATSIDEFVAQEGGANAGRGGQESVQSEDEGSGVVGDGAGAEGVAEGGRTERGSGPGPGGEGVQPRSGGPNSGQPGRAIHPDDAARNAGCVPPGTRIHLPPGFAKGDCIGCESGEAAAPRPQRDQNLNSDDIEEFFSE